MESVISDQLSPGGASLGLQALPPLTRVEGWGMALASQAYLCQPASRAAIEELFHAARQRGLSVAFRGAGCSYSDAALNSHGLVLDLSRMNRILDWDAAAGILTVEPGVTTGQLWRAVLPDGYWPPVVTGTMQTTVGGCAAMDVHGKNNFRLGSFSDHVLDFDLLTPAGELVHCSREQNPDLFQAALGGLGLLGCFVRLRLLMMKVETGLLKIKVTTAPNLKELLTEFGRQAEAAEQLVGWIDAAASGRALGRGILHQATRVWADRVPDPAQTFTLQAQALRRSWLGLPFSLLKHTLRLARRPAGIGFLNGVKYRLTQLGEPWLDPRQSLADFSFLLDYIPDWKHTFRGLGQYQCLIPRDRALTAFTQILRHSQRRGLIPCLAVVKKHRPDRALLSCLLDGYSLALEYPLDTNDMARLRRLADELDVIVGEHGGTIYLAKNASLHPALHSALFPAERLERFFRLKQTCDPEGLLQSDLARRVFGAYC